MTRILLAISAISITSAHLSVAADTKSAAIQYVGSVSIQPSHEASFMADWYRRFGIQTEKMGEGCYGMLQTAAGPFFFGIHARRPQAPAKSSGSVAVVFRVSDYDSYLANAAENGISPQSTEADSTERFAHFIDPDGNEVTIWGK